MFLIHRTHSDGRRWQSKAKRRRLRYKEWEGKKIKTSLFFFQAASFGGMDWIGGSSSVWVVSQSSLSSSLVILTYSNTTKERTEFSVYNWKSRETTSVTDKTLCILSLTTEYWAAFLIFVHAFLAVGNVTSGFVCTNDEIGIDNGNET